MRGTVQNWNGYIIRTTGLTESIMSLAPQVVKMTMTKTKDSIANEIDLNSESHDGTSGSMDHQPEYLDNLVDEIARERDADVVLFYGLVDRHNADRLIRDIEIREKRKNVFLLLVTPGGSPDAAYIIARHLQLQYERFLLFVPGLCKSAGTLMALGAHELVISNYGELGPLDVQLSKKDELGETQSGLVGLDALGQLQKTAYDTFEEFFLNTRIRSGLTSQMCGRIATDLTNGLFTPIYGQIDPLHLGETGRAMSIAQKYGERLIGKSRNISSQNVLKLIGGYPSHTFVIDRLEANDLFEEVTEPTPSEQMLASVLGLLTIDPKPVPETIVKFFSNENQEQ